jgi:predicted nuclease of predicted toxin-antitoxin system
MRILFDQGTPVPLRQHFPEHQVQTAFELGWSRLTNGDLLAAAEKQFDVLVTTDQNLRYQQSLAGRRLAVLVLPTTSWPRLQNRIDEIVKALASLKTGEYLELAH